MKLYEKKGITSYIMLWKNNLSFKTTASSWGRCQSAGEGRAWLWPGGTGWSPRHLHRSSSTRDASRPGVPTCLWFPADWPIEGLSNIVLVKACDYSIIKNMSKNKNNWAGVALCLVDINTSRSLIYVQKFPLHFLDAKQLLQIILSVRQITLYSSLLARWASVSSWTSFV